MRGYQVFPVDEQAADDPPAGNVSLEVVARGKPTTGKVPSMFSSLFQRPAKGKRGSSQVLPFGKSPLGVSLEDDDERATRAGASAGKHRGSKPLLSGGSPNRTAKAAKPSAVRNLFRQHLSLPGRQLGGESVPVRRAISSAGGTTCGSDHTGGNGAKLKLLETSQAFVAEAKKTWGVATSASSSSDGSSTCSLVDALESVTLAAANTACALSSARQQHEEALQKQREQFQLLMESMRARSSGYATPPAETDTASAGTTATASTAPSSLSNPPETIHRTAAERQGPASYVQLHPAPVPTSATEVYRGVHFAIPLGCRVEDGEAPAEVLVIGPNVEVVLELRDGGRNVQLVSSNCVCTVKRMGGRVTVHVLSPLGANRAGGGGSSDAQSPSAWRG